MAVIQANQVERISAEARDVRFGLALLSALASVFFVVGWVASKATLSVAWVCAAVRLGWIEARQLKADGVE